MRSTYTSHLPRETMKPEIWLGGSKRTTPPTPQTPKPTNPLLNSSIGGQRHGLSLIFKIFVRLVQEILVRPLSDREPRDRVANLLLLHLAGAHSLDAQADLLVRAVAVDEQTGPHKDEALGRGGHDLLHDLLVGVGAGQSDVV